MVCGKRKKERKKLKITRMVRIPAAACTGGLITVAGGRWDVTRRESMGGRPTLREEFQSKETVYLFSRYEIWGDEAPQKLTTIGLVESESASYLLNLRFQFSTTCSLEHVRRPLSTLNCRVGYIRFLNLQWTLQVMPRASETIMMIQLFNLVHNFVLSLVMVEHEWALLLIC